MKIITIRRKQLPIKPIYLHKKNEDGTEHLCYMGQILRELGEPTLYKREPVRYVNELKTNIPPFTRVCRDVIVQSDIATTVMNLPPHPESEARLVALLPQFTFIFE